ncbi:MAG: ATP-binding protein [Eubacteriales bacterium]
MLFQKAETAVLEEKGAKLFGITRVLDKKLAGTFDDMLRQFHPAAEISCLSREEKIHVLSGLLYPFTEIVASSFPGVGAGYYSLSLDAILTYSPGASYRNRVGISVDSDHMGRQAMAQKKEVVGVGSMVRGEIMNCVRPLVRDGEAIGFVWANETIEDIYKQIDRGARKIFFSSDIEPVLGLTGLLLLCSKLLLMARPGGEQLPWAVEYMHRYLSIFLNSLNLGILVADAEKRVVFFNHGLSDMLCLDLSSQPAVNRQDCGIFLKRIGLKEIGDAAETLLASKQKQYFSKSAIVLPDGRSKEINYIIAFFTDEHGLPQDMTGTVIVFEDLERSKEEENRLLRADKLATLGELSASIAHEIRNPLAIVLGSLQLLSQRLSDRDFIYSFLRVATHELIRVNNSIEALLDFARFSQPVLVPLGINLLLEETLDFFAVTLESQKVILEKKLSPSLPTVEADTKQIKQAVMNIILNALRAMPEGGLLRISTSHRQGDRFIQIVIADTGCGINEEDRPFIFDAFYSTKEKGSGLGLSLVHRVIDEHQGIIEFDSIEGQGTTFYLYLPVKRFNFGYEESKSTTGREVV